MSPFSKTAHAASATGNTLLLPATPVLQQSHGKK